MGTFIALVSAIAAAELLWFSLQYDRRRAAARHRAPIPLIVELPDASESAITDVYVSAASSCGTTAREIPLRRVW